MVNFKRMALTLVLFLAAKVQGDDRSNSNSLSATEAYFCAAGKLFAEKYHKGDFKTFPLNPDQINSLQFILPSNYKLNHILTTKAEQKFIAACDDKNALHVIVDQGDGKAVVWLFTQDKTFLGTFTREALQIPPYRANSQCFGSPICNKYIFSPLFKKTISSFCNEPQSYPLEFYTDFLSIMMKAQNKNPCPAAPVATL